MNPKSITTSGIFNGISGFFLNKWDRWQYFSGDLRTPNITWRDDVITLASVLQLVSQDAGFFLLLQPDAASAVCSVGQFPVQCNIWRYPWIAPCFLQRCSVKSLWLSDDAFISLQRQKLSHLIPNCKMMKMEEQKMCSCLIWDYKFLKVYYYQWETKQCFCMIARQLIWVKKGWDSSKFADSRGTQIIPEPLKIHLLYTEKFVHFRVSVRKSETPLWENS